MFASAQVAFRMTRRASLILWWWNDRRSAPIEPRSQKGNIRWQTFPFTSGAVQGWCRKPVVVCMVDGAMYTILVRRYHSMLSRTHLLFSTLKLWGTNHGRKDLIRLWSLPKEHIVLIIYHLQYYIIFISQSLLLQHADSTLCIADTSDRPVLFLLPIYCFTLRWLLFYMYDTYLFPSVHTLCPTPSPNYYIRDTLRPTLLVYNLYY